MNRLLVNLVKNAIEAMPDGGEVRIATLTDRSRGTFTVTVEDSGGGIAVDLASRLFEPYTTTKEGGTGLGLAIAHRIASEHGGTLQLVNPGERGARFRLELPLAGVASGAKG
jgi:signal transduction histidine kinase